MPRLNLNQLIDDDELITTGRRSRRLEQHKPKPKPKHLAAQTAVQESFNFTYHASRHEREWIVRSLGSFYEDRWIDDRGQERAAGRCTALRIAPGMRRAYEEARSVGSGRVARGRRLGQGLAAAAIGLPEALGDRLEIVGIDREPSHGWPDAGKSPDGFRRGTAFQTARGRLPAFLQPSAQGWDRSCVGIVLGVAKELIDGIEQSGGIARRGKALCDAAQALGEACVDRVG